MIRKYGRMTGAPVRAAIVLGAVMVPLAVCGQIRFERTYGGPYADLGYSVKQTADGGYVIAGYTQSFTVGDEDVYLIRTDEFGDTLWTRSYGGPWEDIGRCVDITEDGGYVIAGWTRSFGHGAEDFYLVKTDAQGDTMWTAAYGHWWWDHGYSVEQTDDEGYVIAGRYVDDVYLVKTDSAGDTLWTRQYGGYQIYRAYSVTQTSDGGYIVAGEIVYDCWYYWYSHVYVIKTDDLGDTLWIRSYYADEDGTNSGWSVDETPDGGYIIAGDTGTHLYVVKTDGEGDTLWTRKYGGPEGDRGRSIVSTSDGGYAIAGHTESFGAGAWDIYLLKIDAVGDTVWTRTYGGSGEERGCSVDQTSDGGYVIAGYTDSFGAGGWDVYLIKTDANGYVQVADDDVDRLRPCSGYLGQNRPNPFRECTEIVYSLPEPQRATLAIYDVRGAVVRTLVCADVCAGQHRLVWDGRDERGKEVASGVYFCCLEASGTLETRRLVLLR